MDARPEHIAYLLKRITDALAARANCEAKAFELTFAQTRVLGFLYCHSSDVVTQKCLENQFCVSHPSMAGVLHRLAEKGFVRLSVDPRDRRQRVVSITDKGYREKGAMQRRLEESEGAITNGFTDEERERLRSLLRRVYENIREREIND